MTRLHVAFGALVLVQAAHSVEEYVGRLWESFPPARFVTGFASQDHKRGFVGLNAELIGFRLWCVPWPVGRGWPPAVTIWGVWVSGEGINGIGHQLCTRRQYG